MKTTVIILSMIVAITAENLPNGFKVCKLSDPDIEKCISEAFKIALNVLANGDSALKILPIDPLAIDYMRINSSGLLPITQEYRNIKIYGMTKNMQVFIKSFDVNTFAINIVAVFPQLNVTSDYEMNGRILLLPIQGKGKCRATYYNMTVTFDVEYDKYERDGETYLKIKKFIFHINDINDLKGYFENLFGKDNSLGEEMNRLLNENSKMIFNEIKPALEEVFKQVITGIGVKIYSNVPLKKIYPPE